MENQGIDAFIVIGVGFLMTIWDLWKGLNLSHEEQGNQISNVKEEINQTMEKLKTFEDV